MRERPNYIKEELKSSDSSKKIKKVKTTTQIDPINKARTLLKLVRSRRSIRFFKKTPIPERRLMMILEGARWAPSPANSQPWEFIVIRDQRLKRDLMKTMKKVGKTVRKQYSDFPWGTTSRDPELISNVPIVVAVCADLSREELRKYDVFPLKHKKEIITNCIAAAIQNMMLMATALGVGSLWITPVSTSEIKKLLQIPETLQLMALVPLGYPARDPPEKPTRRSLETLVHYERLLQSS